ncbi:hypothetical protein V1478_007507 [Vespula squamosa]|uniref:Maturase K n=1 Tax=Vespula squamosa TaxID=30214 RepID=A0ABD2B3B1_VESSQ
MWHGFTRIIPFCNPIIVTIDSDLLQEIISFISVKYLNIILNCGEFGKANIWKRMPSPINYRTPNEIRNSQHISLKISGVIDLKIQILHSPEQKFKRSSTCCRNFSPKIFVGDSAKQSILDAIEHLLAKYLEILPLFLVPARPINVEWNNNPYLGVLPLVFNALNNAFSAPNI